MPQFMTIRETAKTGLISEHFLRQMVRRGDCPCIKSGNRTLVNITALREKLDAMSKGVDAND